MQYHNLKVLMGTEKIFRFGIMFVQCFLPSVGVRCTYYFPMGGQPVKDTIRISFVSLS